ALISAMKKHQKYFHLVDKDNKLMPNFITISNIESSRRGPPRPGRLRHLPGDGAAAVARTVPPPLLRGADGPPPP
ncbi:MAG TPA: glycine--tRNA ligase subunit beta, partial [Acidobacteria bacterium]|nr:glycine--tRNA ligase subunit beta [Acidobacteriota bacterium]